MSTSSGLLIAAICLVATLLVLNILCWWLWQFLHTAWKRGGPFARAAGGRIFALGPIDKLKRRFPRISAFIQARFEAGRFVGLPLTLMVIAIGYVVFLLAGIIEELFENELLPLDRAIYAGIEPMRSDAVVSMFEWITHFGDMETLTAVCLVVTAMLLVHGPKRFILPFWISVLGAQITSWGGKFFFDRPRPDFVSDVPFSPSFPSGHSASSVSIYMLLAYILARQLNNTPARFQIIYWLTVTSGLVALSRIILGVHYASDVAAGILLGMFWCAVAVAIAELIEHKGRLTLGTEHQLVSKRSEQNR